MLIDCDRCEMRNLACSDCVVNVLLGGEVNEFDRDEQAAIGALADAGLVPPLRLTVATRDGHREPEAPDAPDAPERKKIAETRPRGLPPMRSAG